jgi:hypothetical protein
MQETAPQSRAATLSKKYESFTQLKSSPLDVGSANPYIFTKE